MQQFPFKWEHARVSRRRTESDRVLAAVDRHYRRRRRKGVISFWVRQRRATVILQAVERATTALHRAAVKAWLKAGQFRREIVGNPNADRSALIRLARHELTLARNWRIRAQLASRS